MRSLELVFFEPATFSAVVWRWVTLLVVGSFSLPRPASVGRRGGGGYVENRGIRKGGEREVGINYNRSLHPLLQTTTTA